VGGGVGGAGGAGGAGGSGVGERARFFGAGAGAGALGTRRAGSMTP